MSMYKLRPHHGLCLHYFQGEGYSPEFVENMQEIVDTLETNPEIQLISGADNVCIACPNRRGERDCACDEKVLRYDAKVLALCELEYASPLTWKDFSDIVHKKILSQNLRESVCGDCAWTHLCR